ncbi:unnamed protein product [Cyprideis torosa]|uniref:Uncharacterized protein n=1 Tax=Cyprideis torosa TaxID=163714 RepID=A0A7R8WHV3_9CRUS|nr:unnamed protein product [Cyprideis torosa]CAG0899873.1 unnamed protein product [Cyprideis torosa]
MFSRKGSLTPKWPKEPTREEILEDLASPLRTHLGETSRGESSGHTEPLSPVEKAALERLKEAVQHWLRIQPQNVDELDAVCEELEGKEEELRRAISAAIERLERAAGEKEGSS